MAWGVCMTDGILSSLLQSARGRNHGLVVAVLARLTSLTFLLLLLQSAGACTPLVTATVSPSPNGPQPAEPPSSESRTTPPPTGLQPTVPQAQRPTCPGCPRLQTAVCVALNDPEPTAAMQQTGFHVDENGRVELLIMLYRELDPAEIDDFVRAYELGWNKPAIISPKRILVAFVPSDRICPLANDERVMSVERPSYAFPALGVPSYLPQP